MDRIIKILVDQWVYDVEVLSRGWVLWTVIPALMYVAFMLIKWFVLTCPLWLPLTIIIQSLRGSK